MSRNREAVQRYIDRFMPRGRAKQRSEHVRSDGRSLRGRKGAWEAVRSGLSLLLCAAYFGCTNELPTSSDREIAASEIDRLMIFVRDWPNEYVEVALTRNAGASTLLIYRPPQPGVPRILLDSIGPNKEDPEEMAELLKTFDIWAMADSNAVGAACNTKTGQWVCNPTFNDYSVVIGVTGGGTTRAQRYTRLRESTSNKTARALGDFVLAMARKRQARP